MNILMTAMSCGIGGAETHIAELATELAYHGHSVTVASGGGLLAGSLTEAGVRHVTLPLNSRRISALIRSYFGLRRLIRKGGFDAVHAHARIPAFLCSLICRRRREVFVTTAHYNFKVTPILRRLSRWGDRTLAVSEDVAAYLCREYGISRDRIALTVNGIDSRRFSPVGAATAAEKLPDDLRHGGRQRIICVCRIDKVGGKPAFDTVAATGILFESYPGIEAVIVGDGNDFDALRAAAERVNLRVGREAVKTVGARSDVEAFFGDGGIFVGSSRSALEAMSAGLPVIIHGPQGRLGIFDRDSLDTAVRTNFCARGCGDGTPEQLAHDISLLFDSSDEKLRLLGEYNRLVCGKYYSVAKMADDALALYTDALRDRLCRRSAVAISGYYGFGNSGDELLLRTLIDALRRRVPGLAITVFSHRPRKTSSTYGVAAVGRYNIFALRRELRRCRLLISGGGSLLTDVTSRRSLWYYSAVMLAAARQGVKVMAYANGIGPLKHEASRRRAAKALESASVVTLRDRQSAEAVASLTGEAVEPRVSADPAFLFEKPNADAIAYASAYTGLLPDVRYFAVAARQTGIRGTEAELSEFARSFSDRTGMLPVFAAMQPRSDLSLARRLARAFGDGALVLCSTDADITAAVFARCEAVVGMRLHSLIYAAVAGAVPICLSCDPKIDGLAETLGLSAPVDARTFTAEQLYRACVDALDNKENYTAALPGVISRLRTAAAADADTAAALLLGSEMASGHSV